MAVAKKPDGINLTLLRGRKYTLVHPFDRRKGAYHFEKGVARLVRDMDVVEFAKDLTDVVFDSDGAELEKPMFRFSTPDAPEVSNRRRPEVDESDDEPVRRNVPARRPQRKL